MQQNLTGARVHFSSMVLLRCKWGRVDALWGERDGGPEQTRDERKSDGREAEISFYLKGSLLTHLMKDGGGRDERNVRKFFARSDERAHAR